MAAFPQGEPAPSDGSLPLDSDSPFSPTFHAYLHIPFCKVRCGYCDFNTYTATELRGAKQNDFARVIAREIELSEQVMQAAQAPDRELASVFFGGGTPTQLPAADLVFLLGKLRASFGLAAGAEVTTEANPDDVDKAYLAELAAGGLTRVSFGMQSAVPNVLKVLDRTHEPRRLPEVVKWAKEVGLQTSVDLIYGAPGESIGDWETTLDSALQLETDHISAYSLIVEPGTKLARLISRGELSEPDEDEQATKYEIADSAFSGAGLSWYEVSNWARSPEHQSRHNLAYWNSADWWGFGPGAHSHVAGVRWWNRKHPADYQNRLVGGESPALEREVLTPITQLEERVLLQIRTRSGLPIEVLRELEVFRAETIAGLIADQLVEPQPAIGGILRLTQKGRLLADTVVRQLLA